MNLFSGVFFAKTVVFHSFSNFWVDFVFAKTVVFLSFFNFWIDFFAKNKIL